MSENVVSQGGKEPYKELTEDFNTLDEAVEALFKARSQGKRAFCVFNGVSLDSEIIKTIDYAYILVFGRTKREYDIQEERDKKENERRLIGAIDRIPEQIKRGRKLIYPSRLQEWVKDVATGAIGPNKGTVIEYALEIMEAIDYNMDMKNIVALYDSQKHESNESWNKELVKTYVMKYSKNGFPFYEAVHDGYWNLEECKKIYDIIVDNEQFNHESSENVDLVDSKRKVLTRIKRLQKREEKSIN